MSDSSAGAVLMGWEMHARTHTRRQGLSLNTATSAGLPVNAFRFCMSGRIFLFALIPLLTYYYYFDTGSHYAHG